MKRRKFLEVFGLTGSSVLMPPLIGNVAQGAATQVNTSMKTENSITLHANVVIAGAGMGGFAAALAALKNGQKVIVTEETDWIGGQLSQQGVPPDEHLWIETQGATKAYRQFRDGVRNFYKRNYPLTPKAFQNPVLNPGNGAVSRLCHEPKVAVAVLEEMFAPYLSNGSLTLLLEHKVVKAKVKADFVESVTVKNIKSNATMELVAPYFVDATELGDLLPITGTEYVTGTESREDTGELHAPEIKDPGNVQAFTTCFAMDYLEGENHVIPKPASYDFWSKYTPPIQPAWSGRLLDLHYSDPRTLTPKRLGFHPGGKTEGRLNLWDYRKIISKDNFEEGFYKGDITLVNWPQNDYMAGNLIDVSEKEFQTHIDGAKQLSLSLLYWLQTEAPRPDGGKGWPGLRLRPDVMGTTDGLAKYPYVREARRIKAQFTVLEKHVGKENRALAAGPGEDKSKAAHFYDSVGVGYYHIDLHPTMKVNYVDFPSLRFQIPLGALLPVRMKNLLPANKNIGTTHITNGCYRLHPVEWNIGESVGMLVSFVRSRNILPGEVRSDGKTLREFQDFISKQGVQTEWRDS